MTKFMCRMLETIRLSSDGYDNMVYHSQRFNRTRKELFKCVDNIDLFTVLAAIKTNSENIEKCRVLYRETIEYIEFVPYFSRNIASLQLVYDDSIDYSYKYEDRKALQQLFGLRNTCDDILIVKKNHITDTSFSNIVFLTGNKWVTPSTPLLQGTRCQQLLNDRIIFEEEITLSSLSLFHKAKLINSMLRFEDSPGIDITNIRK